MTNQEFWTLIDQSLMESEAKSVNQESSLRKMLTGVSADEVVDFKLKFDFFIHNAYRWDLWAAAYIIAGGCSDDGFWDFRSWLVSRGRMVYETVLTSPAALINSLSRDDPDHGRKNFLNPASFVWSEITGRPLAECPRLGSNLGQKPAGNEWSEDDLPLIFPALWKEFNR
jgi:hypothetical protein